MINRKKTAVFVLALVSVMALIVAPFLGGSANAIADSNGIASINTKLIMLELRLPRILLAYIVGAALAVSGMTFQSLFKNSLATPFTLGVASGASLGVAVTTVFGISFSMLFISSQVLFAFVGALLAVALVYMLGRINRVNGAATTLLSGVAVSFTFSSLILCIQYISDKTDSYRIIRWLMGGLATVGYSEVLTLLPFVLTGLVVVFIFRKELDLFSLGDEFAISRGVDVRLVQRLLFLATSLMIAGVVSICGPIGFVGMMAPHIVRMLIGAGHTLLFWGVLMFGGVFMVFCDFCSRVVIFPVFIPVGIVTALLGGPFFVWLTVSKRSNYS